MLSYRKETTLSHRNRPQIFSGTPGLLLFKRCAADMHFHSLALLSSATIAIATDGVFNPPKAQSFLSIDYQVGIPFNTTTPNGVVGTVPVRGGDIKGGLFHGHVVPNLTSSVERYLPVVNDVVSTVSSQRTTGRVRA